MHLRLARNTLLIAVLCSIAVDPAAVAGTYQCDNDRAANQYPRCRNDFLNFVLRTGQRGDANGDDRLGSGVYDWLFTGLAAGNRINLRVWLANAAFTDPRALYLITLPGPINYGRDFNQNTAPSGWSFIRQAPQSASNPAIQVFASTARCGADLVEVTTFLQVKVPQLVGGSDEDRIVDSSLCGAARGPDPSVEAIQQRMLNAIDHYADAKGRYRVLFKNNGQDEDVEFESSQRAPGSHVKVISRVGNIWEYRSDGAQAIASDVASQTFRMHQVSASAAPTGPRAFHNDRCEAVFVHREDPAAADTASDVLFPQNFAFWLTDSEAWVARSETIVGRTSTVVEGRLNGYLRDKLGATDFAMWIDGETGTLLKLTLTDADGALVSFIEVADVQFNRGVDVRQFAVSAPSGWSQR